MTSPPTYLDIVRSFAHPALAASPAYAALRQALSDLANESRELDPALTLEGFLDAVRDMTATAPYGDLCDLCTRACCRQHRHEARESCDAYRTWWPHAVKRDGDGITGAYRCANGHEWTCWYAIGAAYLEIS